MTKQSSDIKPSAHGRKKFEAMTEHSPDIIARFDREMRYLYVNQTITEYIGLAPDKFIDKTNRELGMPAHLSGIYENKIGQIFNTGKPCDIFF